ncbi:hypothetical protein Tco_1569543 [Tanacetum coccineum]
MTVMSSNKLQVEESSEMANELLRKIFYEAIEEISIGHISVGLRSVKEIDVNVLTMMSPPLDAKRACCLFSSPFSILVSSVAWKAVSCALVFITPTSKYSFKVMVPAAEEPDVPIPHLMDALAGATGEVIDVGYLLKPMLGQGFNIAVSCLLKRQYLIFMDYMSGINIIIESIMVL